MLRIFPRLCITMFVEAGLTVSLWKANKIDVDDGQELKWRRSRISCGMNRKGILKSLGFIRNVLTKNNFIYMDGRRTFILLFQYKIMLVFINIFRSYVKSVLLEIDPVILWRVWSILQRIILKKCLSSTCFWKYINRCLFLY